jgi:capsular polysaccharide biosynthesis protein/Mrp family chromosome partitioning ATPase
MEERTGSDAMPLAGLAALIRRRWWILAVATLAAALAAHLAVSGRQREYQAQAVVLVGPINAGLDTLRAAGPLAETYSELAKSRPQILGTERRTHVTGLASRLDVTANQTTRLVTIKVRDTNAARAARVANAHAASLVGLAARRASGPIPSGRLQVVDPAVPEAAPVGPGATTLTIAAGLVGLLVALLIVALVDRSSGAVRDAEELEALTGVPCLANVGRAALRHGRTPVVERAPHSRAADEYRLLAAKLDALGARSVAVLPVDGAPGGVVAANLVGALGARGARITLVDLDEGSVRAFRGGDGEQPPAEDLAALEAGTADDGKRGKSVALRRPEASAVEEALRGGTEGARALLRDLLADSDLVVLHPAGGAGSPTGLIWARIAEATLLAVQREHTSRRDVTSAAQSLRQVQARLAGTVLTAPAWRP